MHIKNLYKLFALYILLILISDVDASLNFQIKGISGQLKRNVYARLSNIDKNEISNKKNLQNMVDKEVRKGLCSLGYYSPIINYNFDQNMSDKSDILIIFINPGKPVRISGIDIILYGEACKDNDYKKIINNNQPSFGTILNHRDYDQFKRKLFDLALRKGYFDASFYKSQLKVSPDRYQAYWNIHFNSGKRYRVEKLNFHGTKIHEKYLKNLSHIHKGEFYSSESLAELNRRMISTNWFKSVMISPKFKNNNQENILSLEVEIVPQKKNSIEAGIGYSTNIGPKIKTIWKKPILNSHGHSLETIFNLSIFEKSVNLNYKIPILKNPLEQFYLLYGEVKREKINYKKFNHTNFNLTRCWNLSNGWQKAINFRYSFEYYTHQDGTKKTAILIYPSISINRTRQRGGSMPTWGDNQRYSVDISNTILGSDINFFIIQAQNVWIRTFKEKHRFLIHGNFGWIETHNFKNIPLSLRYLSGRNQIIRGYKYKSRTSHNSNIKIDDSSTLATGLLEYQYNMIGKWWTTLFIDNNKEMRNIKKINFKTRAGVGLHWQSPIGPIKLDFYTNIVNQKEKDVQFYIGLGPEL